MACRRCARDPGGGSFDVPALARLPVGGPGVRGGLRPASRIDQEDGAVARRQLPDGQEPAARPSAPPSTAASTRRLRTRPCSISSRPERSRWTRRSRGSADDARPRRRRGRRPAVGRAAAAPPRPPLAARPGAVGRGGGDRATVRRRSDGEPAPAHRGRRGARRCLWQTVRPADRHLQRHAVSACCCGSCSWNSLPSTCRTLLVGDDLVTRGGTSWKPNGARCSTWWRRAR